MQNETCGTCKFGHTILRYFKCPNPKSECKGEYMFPTSTCDHHTPKKSKLDLETFNKTARALGDDSPDVQETPTAGHAPGELHYHCPGMNSAVTIHVKRDNGDHYVVADCLTHSALDEETALAYAKLFVKASHLAAENEKLRGIVKEYISKMIRWGKHMTRDGNGDVTGEFTEEYKEANSAFTAQGTGGDDEEKR